MSGFVSGLSLAWWTRLVSLGAVWLFAWPAHAAATVATANLLSVRTVFIIMMENSNWQDLKGDPDAPYLNNVLLPVASHCEKYSSPPDIHPSEPNYLWLEAGTNFGILDDNDPDTNHQAATNHLVTLLSGAGISWRAYQEDISGDQIPLTSTNGYTPRHDPFVYFDDVTGTNNPTWPYGLTHIRPHTELAADLASNRVARYNFITPNLCHDMHDTCYPDFNVVQQGDNWLAAEVPKILNSAAYTNNGALFIIWDEGENQLDGPIGMILLSPLARGGGYFNSIYYTHSSTLRTLQEIFGVTTPMLGDAANAPDLSDLFSPYAVSVAVDGLTGTNGGTGAGPVQLTVSGVIPGKTNLVQVSGDLRSWTSISTNCVSTNCFTVVDGQAGNSNRRYYRAVQVR